MLNQFLESLIQGSSIHPAIIQDSTHVAVLTATLHRIANDANNRAKLHLKNNENPNRSAGAVLSAMINFHASQIVLNLIETDAEDFKHIYNRMAGTAAQARDTADAIWQTPNAHRINPDSLMRYANTTQAELNNKHVKRLAADLSSSSEETAESLDALTGHRLLAAHTATIDQIANQPNPFDQVDQDHRTTVTKTETLQIAQRALTRQEERLPVQGIGYMERHPDADPKPMGKPLSTASPQLGFYEIGNTRLLDYAARVAIDPTGDHGDPPSLRDSDSPDIQLIPYTAFIYDGTRYIKTLEDPYPKGFPDHLATIYADLMHQAFQQACESGNTFALLTYQAFHPSFILMKQAALKGLHDVSAEDIKSIITAARAQGLGQGATHTVVEALTGEDPSLAHFLTGRLSSKWKRTANRSQAKEVISTARGASMDNHAIAGLAKQMGYTPTELDIPEPDVTHQQVLAIQEAAEKAGLSHKRVEQMVQTLTQTT